MDAKSGAPCWASLVAHDADSARHFYSSVLGWEYRSGGTDGSYTVAHDADGAPVAGLAAMPTQAGWPASWSAYFSVDSADDAASRVTERGATVAVGPVRFGGGRTVLAADQVGAVFGLWEGGEIAGWQVGRFGSPAWLELHTGDPFAAAVFYGEVVGWATDETSSNEVTFEHDEVFVRSNGHIVAGMRGVMSAHEPDHDAVSRPHWRVYFRVPDVDRVAQTAMAAGGHLEGPPTDTKLGRVAVFRDPEGARFAVISGEG